MRRVNHRPAGRLRRGFSLVESLISLVMFLMVAALITWSLTSAYAARTIATSRASVTAAVTTTLDTLVQTPVVDLASGTFTVPEACDGSGTGISGRSCVATATGQVTIAYRFVDPVNPGKCPERSADPQLVLASTGMVQVQACVAAVTSSAFVSGTTGAEVGVPAQTRTLTPAPGYRAHTRAVSVRLAGDLGALADRPVRLVLVGSPTTQVAEAAVDPTGRALLVLDPVSVSPVCTTANPCVVALSASADPTLTGEPDSASTPTVRAHDAAGDAAPVSVGDRSTAQVSLVLAREVSP